MLASMGRRWDYFLGLVLILLIGWEVEQGVRVDAIGVNWGTIAYNPLPNAVVVKMLKDNNINKVKLFDSNPSVIKSMAGTNIEVMIGIPNDMLVTLAGSTDAAAAWVKQNVTQYTGSGGVNIRYVGVGNEPFLNAYAGQFQTTALPALKNVQTALTQAGHSNVWATIPCNADVLSNNPLPSQQTFRSDLAPLLTQVTQFLNSTGAPFIVNLYPFLSLVLGTGFPIDYAFFDGSTSAITDGTHVYQNVFDASYDGLVSALTAAGTPNVPIIVGEIGWPTDGQTYATIPLSSKFMSELVTHMENGNGTPLRPGKIEGYLFGLLDEDEKSILPGPFERHWGIFNYDGSLKYPLDLTGGSGASLVAAQNVLKLPTQWCVLNPNGDLTQLQANVDYACSHGDCTPLLSGGSCDTLSSQANASYAFNNYYQFNDQVVNSCNFQGLAQVTQTDPSIGSCHFLIGLRPVAAATTSTPTSGASISLEAVRIVAVSIAGIVVSSFILF